MVYQKSRWAYYKKIGAAVNSSYSCINRLEFELFARLCRHLRGSALQQTVKLEALLIKKAMKKIWSTSRKSLKIRRPYHNNVTVFRFFVLLICTLNPRFLDILMKTFLYNHHFHFLILQYCIYIFRYCKYQLNKNFGTTQNRVFFNSTVLRKIY